MNALPEVKTTRRPGLVALALVLIAVLTLAFVGLAHHRNVLQRQNAARVAAQTQAAQALQQANQAPSPWRLQSRVPVAAYQPAAIASARNRAYVAVGDGVCRYALYFFDGRLSLLSDVDVELPLEPRAVAAFGDGVAVASDARVRLLDPNGKALSNFAVGGDRTRITSLLAVGKELWVADSGQRAIWRYEPGGRLLGKLGSPDPASGYPGLLVPSPHLDLALTPAGNVLVNNPGKQRVETWSPQGKLVGQFGKAAMAAEGFAGCCNPIAVAVLPDGRVVTAEKGLVRVKVYRADGAFEALVATTPTLSHGVDNLDLATTTGGEVLVLDPRARAILIFSEDTTTRPQGSR